MADETPPLGTNDPDIASNPRKMYKMLRDHSPVVEMQQAARTGTLVSKHEDAVEILRHPEIFSSNDDAVDIGQKRPLIPLQLDPPEQTKYRKLMAPLFAPKAVDALEGPTRALAVELGEKVSGDGSCNFHSAIAEPLPSTQHHRAAPPTGDQLVPHPRERKA